MKLEEFLSLPKRLQTVEEGGRLRHIFSESGCYNPCTMPAILEDESGWDHNLPEVDMDVRTQASRHQDETAFDAWVFKECDDQPMVHSLIKITIERIW